MRDHLTTDSVKSVRVTAYIYVSYMKDRGLTGLGKTFYQVRGSVRVVHCHLVCGLTGLVWLNCGGEDRHITRSGTYLMMRV